MIDWTLAAHIWAGVLSATGLFIGVAGGMATYQIYGWQQARWLFLYVAFCVVVAPILWSVR